MTEPTGVVAPLQAAILTETEPIPFNCLLFMNSDSPLEIIFLADEQTADGAPVEWHFSRELVIAAMNGEDKVSHGEGDIQIYTDTKYIFHHLINAETLQACIVAFFKSDYAQFLAACEGVAPMEQSQHGSFTDEDFEALLNSSL